MNPEAVDVLRWTSEIKEYSAAKKAIPTLNFARSTRTLRPEFDTILCSFKDPKSDFAFTSQIQKNTKTYHNSSENVQQIIAHTASSSLPPPPQPQYNFNVITCEGNPKPSKTRTKKINESVFRDFNIVTNKFWVDDIKKRSELANINKKTLIDKFEKTHDFDLIRGEYYDPLKENTMLRKEQQVEEAQRRRKAEKIPRSYVREKEDCSQNTAFDALRHRSIVRYKNRPVIERALREQGDKQEDFNENRAIQRFKQFREIDKRTLWEQINSK